MGRGEVISNPIPFKLVQFVLFGLKALQFMVTLVSVLGHEPLTLALSEDCGVKVEIKVYLLD